MMAIIITRKMQQKRKKLRTKLPQRILEYLNSGSFIEDVLNCIFKKSILAQFCIGQSSLQLQVVSLACNLLPSFHHFRIHALIVSPHYSMRIASFFPPLLLSRSLPVISYQLLSGRNRTPEKTSKRESFSTNGFLFFLLLQTAAVTIVCLVRHSFL